MAVVQGKNVVIKHYYNGEWLVYACATACSYGLNTALLNTSGKGTGQWSTFLPTRHTARVTFEGVVLLEEAGKLGLADLRAMQISGVKQLVTYERTDEDGNVYSERFYGYIVDSEDTGRAGEFNTFSLQIQPSGAITQIYVPTTSGGNGVLRYDDYTPIEGATEVVIPELANKEILEIVKDGMGFNIILAPAVPVGKQASYDVTDGTFVFGLPFAGDEDKPYWLYQPL